MGFEQMWSALEPIGRDPRTGGYRRFVHTDAERACREWFIGEADQRGLAHHTDRNGNLWAWLGDPARDGPGIVTGSHLDSVPDGGAFDGPLGVVSAFAALDLLRERAVAVRRPLAIAAFADEEGARFGVACAGSRLLTGTLDPATAKGLTDATGTTYAQAMADNGLDPDAIGRDEETLGRIGAFVELHIEQGRSGMERPVALGEGIWPHGRWRFGFTGRADHAGTTRMEDRRDPMLSFAMTALAANKRARLQAGRATFGRVEVEPNGTNAVPSAVRGWLDARAESEEALTALLADIERQAHERASRDGTELEVVQESRSPLVAFSADLTQRLARVLDDPPVLPTQAGHDAGILAAAGIPTAMLYVRNPTGVSHAPQEHADSADCLAGVEALADCLVELST